MALKKILEVVTIQADSIIEGETVVSFSCRVDEQGVAGTVTQIIRHDDLFREHRESVRDDFQEFQRDIWAVEDRLTKIWNERNGE